MTTIRFWNRSTFGLALGLVLGLLAVGVSILAPTSGASEDRGAIAVVNGAPISRDKFLSYLRALAADSKDPIDVLDAQYVRQRLIEEELLVQRGVEVGLLQNDKATRAALINAVVGLTTAAAEAKAPTDAELAEFFDANLDYFSPGIRLRVRQVVVQGVDAAQKASEAQRRLRSGEAFHLVRDDIGSGVAHSVPDRLLPALKLREYLGPTLVAVLAERRPGFVSDPQPTDNGFRIAQLVDKESGAPPRLEDIRAQVEVEYARRAGDRALRDYLEWLKDRADIAYPSELPL